AIGQALTASTQALAANEQKNRLDAAANLAMRQGGDEAADARRRTRRLLGTQRAAAGAAGVDVGSGSPLMTALETLAIGAEDVNRITRKTAVRAWGYRTAAEDAAYEGQMALATGALNIGGTLSMDGALNPTKPPTTPSKFKPEAWL
ncbi:MAG: hypothetical protein ABFD94_07890, partial [Armatimonadia bacterium]